MELETLYQDIILDHYKKPRGRGLREPFEAQDSARATVIAAGGAQLSLSIVTPDSTAPRMSSTNSSAPWMLTRKLTRGSISPNSAIAPSTSCKLSRARSKWSCARCKVSGSGPAAGVAEPITSGM